MNLTMIWNSLFVICIVQGLFLIFVIFLKRNRNPVASRLISIIVLLMVISSTGHLVIRTDVLYWFPQLYGVSWGTLFLMGPLLYLYSRAVMDFSFQWKITLLLHFIPYVIQVSTMVPYFVMERDFWVNFIHEFLAGNVKIGLHAKIVYAIQTAHFLFYIILTLRWQSEFRNRQGAILYLIPLSLRSRWIKSISYAMVILVLTVFSLYVFTLILGRFHAVTNYVYTVIVSGIIYFMTYVFITNPEIFSPDFLKKYKDYMSFSGIEGEKYRQRIQYLLDNDKIYLNPDLNLSHVADMLGLPPHQLSKLINEKLGKSFSDLINEYRVKEFISRVSAPTYNAHSIYGIALDAGFNSKSSFNSAFKKVTGRTPSEFRSNN